MGEVTVYKCGQWFLNHVKFSVAIIVYGRMFYYENDQLFVWTCIRGEHLSGVLKFGKEGVEERNERWMDLVFGKKGTNVGKAGNVKDACVVIFVFEFVDEETAFC